jgi:hypothetical protein
MIDKMQVGYRILPEDDIGGYTLSWNDTLFKSQFTDEETFLIQRPLELHCYILNNNNDTFGYYRGVCNPQQFTYFQLNKNTDSIINLNFSIGINHFSEFLEEQSEEDIEEFYENNKMPIKFETLKNDLRKTEREKLEIVLLNIEKSNHD